MVEAEVRQSDAPSGGSQLLGLAPVDKTAALGLFRQAELDTHVDIVLRSYITEAEKVAQVSLLQPTFS